MAAKDKRANGSAKRANGSAADDAEFEKLLDEMEELGHKADALRAKVNHLIDEMRENDVPADEEVGEGTGGGAAAEESNDVAVNEGSAVDDEGSATDDEGSATDDEGSAADDEATDEDGDPDAT